MVVTLISHCSIGSRLQTGTLLALLLTVSLPATADEIRIATASNFRDAMTALISEFEKTSQHRVVAIYGSTGKHFAQIINGAPFDAFLAADAQRPERLEQEGFAIPGSRFTYATGELVLWSPRTGFVDAKGRVLEAAQFHRLSMANPDLAPYGAAAKEVLVALGMWEALSRKLVLGENIGQAYLFVRSGNAELGFIARSQLVAVPPGESGSMWQVPAHLHRPIDQQAVLLRKSEAAQSFMAFIRGARAAGIIQANGYAATVSDQP